MRITKGIVITVLLFFAIQFVFTQEQNQVGLQQSFSSIIKIQDNQNDSIVIVDFNGNHIFEESEKYIISNNLNEAVKWKNIFEKIVQDKKRFNTKALERLAEGLSSFVVPELGKVEKNYGVLLSYLSFNGIHPYKKQNIYYLPDGSGEIAYKPDRALFYSNGMLQYVEDTNRDRTITIVTLSDGRKVPASDAGFYQGTGMLQGSQLREFTRFILPNGEEAWCNYIGYYKSGSISYANPAGEKGVLPNGIELKKPVNIEYYESGKIKLVSVNSDYRINVSFPSGSLILITDWAKVLVNTPTAGAKTKVEFKVDTVVDNFAGKIEFSETGNVIGLGIWEKPHFNPPLQ